MNEWRQYEWRLGRDGGEIVVVVIMADRLNFYIAIIKADFTG